MPKKIQLNKNSNSLVMDYIGHNVLSMFKDTLEDINNINVNSSNKYKTLQTENENLKEQINVLKNKINNITNEYSININENIQKYTNEILALKKVIKENNKNNKNKKLINDIPYKKKKPNIEKNDINKHEIKYKEQRDINPHVKEKPNDNINSLYDELSDNEQEPMNVDEGCFENYFKK